MPDPGVLELAGAKPTKPTKYTNLQTLKWIGGLQTQRSPLTAIDTRYNTRFLGGKPDALYSGTNCEISNELTLQRRPGLIPYSTASIPPPDFFYSWQQTSPPNISLLVDTASAVYDYTPTSATIVFNKSISSGQTYFYDIANTVYMGDGIDLLKYSGPGVSPPEAPVTSTVPGGTLSGATLLVEITYLTLNGETVSSSQTTQVVSSNHLLVVNSPTAIPGAVAWNLYVKDDTRHHHTTGLSLQNSLPIPIGTNYTEPLTGLVFGSNVPPTSDMSGSVVNWGIVGPTTAPTLTNAPAPSPYPSWIANTWFSPSLTLLDTNGNIQLLTTGGTTGTTQPTWNVTVGGVTNESVHGGTAVWTNQGSGTWVASTAYTVGDLVYATFTVTVGSNSPPPPINPHLPPPPPPAPPRTITYNNVFMCTTAGTSGGDQPVWKAGVGTTVADGPTLVWTNQGNQTIWTTIGASTNMSLLQIITDVNGNAESIFAPGKSGATAPTWATALNAVTQDNTAQWMNIGPPSIGTGGGIYSYVYSFVNGVTGQFSNASPVGGPITLAPNSYISVQGVGSIDPQVTSVAIFRTDANGAFYYLDNYVPNPGSGTWTFLDTTTDLNLDTDIFAPLGDINSPPPAGLINFEFFAGRMWGSVGPYLYYASSNDNATLLNIGFNGVSAESWSPINVIPFNAQIVRIINVSNTLWVFTTEDMWAITGTNLTNFAPTRVLVGHGIQSYNALDTDGAVLYVYTGDQQFLSISPNAGSLEIGFPIGDTLQATISSTSAYVARHVAGSEDNAVYIADGSTGWYRLNPNQTGASASGEQAPVWSPNALIVGGCGAVQSIEVDFGIHKLLVGQTTTGPVLMRDLATFSDNGTPYPWNAVIGSVVLAPPGELAEVESITVESKIVAVPVAILANEIAGSFENLNIGSNPINDPPGYPASSSLFSKRYYLSEGTVPPLMRHTQVQVSGIAEATKDEVLTLTTRGVLVPEQA